ncbi:C4-dicarboxylic acid transporter DauA [Cardiobacteriaceae bacterium TAE3-ERU3]|nr:C4-dicarboxylic acid transporter DauA [Cardiobacteriaceae bacterium TAE3-ERU3]
MTSQHPLRSLRIGYALRQACITERYNGKRLLADCLAGITVGIIAIPLSMALAIASGVAPQYGLYTAAIAGLIIALTGGSRYSISGPTAAFVVILLPITNEYGLSGLLVATSMAGIILILMAILRLGRLIEYIPHSVTLGFTGGIAIVIAVLQINDFFGLDITELPEHFLPKLGTLLGHLGQTHWPSLLVASATLATMLIWPHVKGRLPLTGHLPAVLVGVIVAMLLNQSGHPVDTIGSRFHYLLADGTSGNGIPPVLPNITWPWAHGDGLTFSWTMIGNLLPAAFAIAMLGAIESLLCAVVLDGMTNTRHSANSELLGQGIGNLVVPFFGGITATAAIARSAANVRAGATSPIAATVHALLVFAAIMVLAPALAWLPMASMAALLLMVAWGMSEAPKALHLLKTAPLPDILVFFTCLGLTVFVDMVVAITAGVLLAALMFVQQVAAMTKISDISEHPRLIEHPLPQGWAVYKINGPLFFAAADRFHEAITTAFQQHEGIILYMDGVSIIDEGGLMVLTRLIDHCQHHGKQVIIADLQFQPLKTLARAGIQPVPGVSSYTPTLAAALEQIRTYGNQP